MGIGLTFDWDAVEVDVDAVFAALLRRERDALDAVAQIDDVVRHRTSAADDVQLHVAHSGVAGVAAEREFLPGQRSRQVGKLQFKN